MGKKYITDMTNKRMKHIKSHFDTEAGIFDEQVVKFVPHYIEMLGALVTAIPFSSSKKIRVADLGCGTGTISFLVKKRFPKAHITCIDLSENMLTLAKKKLDGLPNIKFELGELNSYSFKERFDVVVSSLALHHLEKKEKTNLWRKIFNALPKGRVFINADIIISADNAMQKKYLEKWGEFVLLSNTKQQMQENYKRYLKEDRPTVLSDDLEGLRNIGFRHTEILWKYYNFAVFCAVR